MCLFVCVCNEMHVCFKRTWNSTALSVTTPFFLPHYGFCAGVCVCLFAQLVLCSLYRQQQPNPTAVLTDSEPTCNEGPTLRCENKLQLSMNTAPLPPPFCQSAGYTHTNTDTKLDPVLNCSIDLHICALLHTVCVHLCECVFSKKSLLVSAGIL